MYELLVIFVLALDVASSRPIPATPDLQQTISQRGQKPLTRGVWFANIEDGATVHSPVRLEFGVAGREVRPVRDGAVAGSGHFHILVDLPKADQIPAEGQEIPFDEAHKHYGKGQMQDDGLALAPGWHTLSLVLADHDHISFGPEFSVVIKIHVTTEDDPGNDNAAANDHHALNVM